MNEIDSDAQEYLLQGPIPGQSLTNSKEAPYAWEQPPRYTSVKEATEVIFFEMLKDENLETISAMMMDGNPITDIAQMLLTVDAASDEEAEEDIELNSRPNTSAKEEVFKAANVNPASVRGLEIQEKLEDINPKEIKQSILEKRKDNTPSSLLSKPEEN